MRCYAEFRGRARRIEFWEFLGGWAILTMLALACDQMRAGPYGHGDDVIVLIVTVAHVIPFGAVATRRSHDLDRAGWLSLLGFVPLVGLAMLALWAFPGTSGPNRFGPEPALEPRIPPEPVITPQRRVVEGHVEPSLASAWPTSSSPAQLGEVFALIDELERLSQLRFIETLTDDEFEVLKGRLLARGAR